MNFLKRARIIEPLVAGAATRSVREAGGATLHSMAEAYLRKMNFKPIYRQQDNPEIADMRRRLNTERGVLIGNHPGSPDSVVLLNLLTRPDVKAFASGGISYKRLAAAFGEKYLIEATSDPHLTLQSFRQIARHIHEGGLLLIFPNGGDGGDSERIAFRDGFRVIVERILRPTDMVYTCWIDPTDVREIKKNHLGRGVGLASELFLPENIPNSNSLRQTLPIHVDEYYTQADQWRHVLNPRGTKQERNMALTDHFLRVVHKESR